MLKYKIISKIKKPNLKFPNEKRTFEVVVFFRPRTIVS